MLRFVVGVVGSNTEAAKAEASQLGNLIAQEKWVVMSGGRDSGVMEAVNKSASDAGGLTIGILPNQNSRIAPGVQVAVITDMNNARNNVIGLSSDVLVACGVDGAGTASEVALALKNEKHVILLAADPQAIAFFQGLEPEKVHDVNRPEEVIGKIREVCGARLRTLGSGSR